MALDPDAVAVALVRELAALTEAMPPEQVVHTIVTEKVEASAPSVWARADVMPGSFDPDTGWSEVTVALMLQAAPAQEGLAAPFKRTGGAAMALVEATAVLRHTCQALFITVAGEPVRISIPTAVSTPIRVNGNPAGHAQHQTDLTFAWRRDA